MDSVLVHDPKANRYIPISAEKLAQSYPSGEHLGLIFDNELRTFTKGILWYCEDGNGKIQVAVSPN